MSKTWILTMPLGGFALFGKGYAHRKSLFRGLIPAVTVATVTKDIAGFRLPFAIGAQYSLSFLALQWQLGGAHFFWISIRFVLHFVLQTLSGLPKLTEDRAIGIRQRPLLLGFGLSIAGLVLALVMIVINW